MNWLSQITPKQFFIASVIYAILAVVLGFWLSGFMLGFVGALGVIYLALTAYTYTKPPITDSKFGYIAAPAMIIFFLVMHGGIFSIKDFVTDKSQLQSVQGVVPSESTYIRGSGKGAKSRDYLTLGSVRMHCSEDEMDECKQIYAYVGQTATAYYQADTRFGNLAYEIEVNGQKIYEFNHQLQTFKYQRHIEKRQIAWAVLIYLVPAILFFMVSRFVVADLPIKSKDEQSEDFKRQKIKQQLHNKKAGASGIFLSMVYILVIIIALLFFLFGFLGDKNFALIGIGSVLMLVFMYLIIDLHKKSIPTEAEIEEVYQQQLLQEQEIAEQSPPKLPSVSNSAEQSVYTDKRLPVPKNPQRLPINSRKIPKRFQRSETPKPSLEERIKEFAWLGIFLIPFFMIGILILLPASAIAFSKGNYISAVIYFGIMSAFIWSIIKFGMPSRDKKDLAKQGKISVFGWVVIFLGFPCLGFLFLMTLAGFAKSRYDMIVISGILMLILAGVMYVLVKISRKN